jgi:hypothetical protein
MSIADPETLPDVLGFAALYAIWLLGLYAILRSGWL